VNTALILGALWTVPVGVAIGSNPRFARIAQPLVQMAASIPPPPCFQLSSFSPAPARRTRIAAMLLMLLGTQWYILFNVIAGAMAIPTDLKEAAEVFRFSSWDRWRQSDPAGDFSLSRHRHGDRLRRRVNAASCGIFSLSGRIVSTAGLGSTISSASDAGRFDVLLASTLIMATIVCSSTACFGGDSTVCHRRASSWKPSAKLVQLFFFFLRCACRRSRRRRLFTPDVLSEPLFIFFHHGALLFWFRDAVAESFVDDHLYRYAAVLQCLPQFERVGMGTRRSFSPCWMSVGVLALAM